MQKIVQIKAKFLSPMNKLLSNYVDITIILDLFPVFLYF